MIRSVEECVSHVLQTYFPALREQKVPVGPPSASAGGSAPKKTKEELSREILPPLRALPVNHWSLQKSNYSALRPVAGLLYEDTQRVVVIADAATYAPADEFMLLT